MAQLTGAQSPIMLSKGATYGTFSSPTAANAIVSYALQVTQTGEEVMREANDLEPGMVLASEFFNRGSTFAFTTRWGGSGAAGTASGQGLLYRACGFSETIVPASPGPGSVTYALLSSQADHEWVDMLAVQGKTKYASAGCRGTFTLTMEAGQFPRYEWEMQGLWTAPSQTSLPGTAYTFANQAQAKIVSSANTPTVTLGGTGICLRSFSLTLGNQITGSDDGGCAPKREITGRQIAAEIVMRAQDYATFDHWAKHLNRTTEALSIIHGTTAGMIQEISIPSFAYGNPQRSDANGIEAVTIPLQILHTAGSSNHFTLIER